MNPGAAPRGQPNPLRLALLTFSTLAILVATLRPSGTTVHGWSFALGSGDEAVAEVIQNLLLFIPLGIALTLLGVRPLRAIAIGAVLSFSVEFLQQWIPGRDPSVGDVVCNTVSTAIGVALVRYARQWLWVPPQRSAWQALATAALAVLAWLTTGIALHPFLPAPPYHTVATPDFHFWGRYQGRVISAAFAPFPLSVDVRDGDVRVVAAPKPPGRASPLVAILDDRETKVLLLTVDGTDLGLRWYMRAVPLRLEWPDLRLREALRDVAPGDSFDVRMFRAPGKVCLAVNRVERCGLGYTVGDGWKLIFYPEHFPAWALGLINAMWIAGWMLGVGYWSGRAGKNPLVYAAVAVAILGLVLVPVNTGLKMTPVVEWLGALLGFVGGYAYAARTRSGLVNPGLAARG